MSCKTPIQIVDSFDKIKSQGGVCSVRVGETLAPITKLAAKLED